jgi:hypothetical protein
MLFRIVGPIRLAIIVQTPELAFLGYTTMSFYDIFDATVSSTCRWQALMCERRVRGTTGTRPMHLDCFGGLQCTYGTVVPAAMASVPTVLVPDAGTLLLRSATQPDYIQYMFT